jgi:hypothetical protein
MFHLASGATQACMSSTNRSTAMKTDDPKRTTTIEKIAKEILWLETLDARGRDSLDFHELSVGSIRAALVAAYEAGRQAAKK